MDDMLRRALGEAVEIETVVGAGLWNTFVDPAQIENALLNLAINARDAMDGARQADDRGRQRRRSTTPTPRTHADVAPGQYVMLAVTDTGSGMTPEVMAQVFEPFFTTKPEGKGTGLGLSMVYGFVKQSGGHVKIYSELGQGTTIKHLPAARRAGRGRGSPPADAGAGRPAARETILVVEDDDDGARHRGRHARRARATACSRPGRGKRAGHRRERRRRSTCCSPTW